MQEEGRDKEDSEEKEDEQEDISYRGEERDDYVKKMTSSTTII